MQLPLCKSALVVSSKHCKSDCVARYRPPVPRPIHSVGPVAISPHNGGAFGELSLKTEKEESDRLDAARNKVVEELESWRAKLIQYESEIKSLRKDIEGT